MPDRRIGAAVIHVVAGRARCEPSIRARHDCFFAVGSRDSARREVSSIKNVATDTSTSARQRGHRGVRVLALTPSRYDSDTPQWGHGRNDAVAIRSPHHLGARASEASRGYPDDDQLDEVAVRAHGIDEAIGKRHGELVLEDQRKLEEIQRIGGEVVANGNRIAERSPVDREVVGDHPPHAGFDQCAHIPRVGHRP